MQRKAKQEDSEITVTIYIFCQMVRLLLFLCFLLCSCLRRTDLNIDIFYYGVVPGLYFYAIIDACDDSWYLVDLET